MPQTYEATPRALRVIWYALLVSTVIYGGIILFLYGQHEQRPFGEVVRGQLTIILYALAVASFVGGTITWSVMSNRPLRARMIVSMAIFESAAIYGLMAAFLAHDWRLYIPPWILAIAGFLRAFPSDEAIAESNTATPGR